MNFLVKHFIFKIEVHFEMIRLFKGLQFLQFDYNNLNLEFLF